MEAGPFLRFWGVRGSIPSPGPATVRYGGNTSCVEMRADGELIVLDAGTGIRDLGLALAREHAGRPMDLTLLISHTHWDHIQGFPFFPAAWGAENRIRVMGFEGASSGLRQTLAGQMESPYFPVGLDEMPGHLEIHELRDPAFQIGAVRVRAHAANHPGKTVGYRFQTSAGDFVYLPDNEPVKPGASGAAIPDPAIVDFVRGADVLVTDCQYTAEEYASHVGWGHGCVDDVVRLAGEAGVTKLVMFHHDPAHDDAMLDAMLEGARHLASSLAPGLVVDAAREGETVAAG